MKIGIVILSLVLAGPAFADQYADQAATRDQYVPPPPPPNYAAMPAVMAHTMYECAQKGLVCQEEPGVGVAIKGPKQ